MDAKTAKEVGEFLRQRASAEVKMRGGEGAITRANAQRVAWELAKPTKRAKRFPTASAVVDPGIIGMAGFLIAGGIDFFNWCARYGRGPVAEFMALAESIKARRPKKRLPGWLSAARGRMSRKPADLADDTIETLEAMRFNDPRSALKSTRCALKIADGPIAVGRVLAIHASNLREVDELGEALLALWVAIPALDVGGDLWGMGRSLSAASGVVQACGRFDLARALVDEAERAHIRAGSVVGRGAAMALRGGQALDAGSDTHAALRELDAANVMLSGASRWRCASVHQARALAFVRLGDLASAREAIAKAFAQAPNARVLRGRIAWHAADIESAAGDHAEAEALFRQAFDMISEPICDRLLVFDQAERAATRRRETARTARRKRLRRQTRTRRPRLCAAP